MYKEYEESARVEAGLAYALSIRGTANTAVGSAVWREVEGVVTRSHVPGRRESVRGGCDKNLLFLTPRPMTLRVHLGRWQMA